MRIFAGVPRAGGVKRQRGCRRASFFTAQCYAERCYATYIKLSVRLTVCLWRSGMIFTQIGNTSKIISRPNSLRYLLTLIPTWATWSNGNTPKNRVEWVWGLQHKKPAISSKRCKIGPRLLWRTNRKSHRRFRLAPKSMTLHDLERPKRHSCRNKIVLRSPP